MKFIFQLVVIAVVAYVSQLFLPWYSVAGAAFIFGYFLKSKANFLAGFLAIALLWIVQAWLLDRATASDLSQRVAHLLTIQQQYVLYGVMALLGGLVGGFAALTGALLKPRRKPWYEK